MKYVIAFVAFAVALVAAGKAVTQQLEQIFALALGR